MKKLAVLLVMMTCFVGAARAEVIGGFWSVDFGHSAPQATAQMEKNSAVLVFDSLDHRLGRTMLWRGTFYDKPCLVQMWFGNSGLWRTQVSFKTSESVPNLASDLLSLLTSKYGSPSTSAVREGTVHSWRTMQKTLDMTVAPGTSSTAYDTVLTYTDRARAPK